MPQLAARMAVHQLEAVFIPWRACVEQLDDFRGEQAELAFLAGRVAPARTPLASLTRTPIRGHRVGLGVAQDRSSSAKFSTTGMMVRPSLVADAASMYRS